MSKLLIFFDNQTFKLNSSIFNYIKRWVTYQIINNIKEFNEIIIYKTCPELIEKKINISDIENIFLDILIWINNIIYKKYDIYKLNTIKNIIDEIKKNNSNNLTDFNINDLNKNTNEQIKKDKILIFISIYNYIYDYDEKIIKYINDTLDNNNFDIKFINISSSCAVNILFPKVNEHYIDIHSLKISHKDFDKFFPLKNTDNMNYLNEYSDINSKFVINILKYVELLYFIESYFNDENKNQNMEIYKIINNILNNTKIIGIDEDNLLEQNIIKSYNNAIKNYLTKWEEFKIKFPIDKLSPNITESYIKYILEFYSIMYPKIYQTNLNNFSTKTIFNKNKNLTTSSLSEIKIKLIHNLNIQPDDNSINFLKSTLTMTNWVEEYANANPFGFLIRYCPCKLSYRGILDLNSSILKTYPNMIVNNVTTNFVPLYDYYQIIMFDYENNNNDNIDNILEKKKFFNISNFNINDNINGSGNVMLPLYINKFHWELTKSIWTYHLTFINNCFEYEYNKKMDSIYFLSIFKLINVLKNSKTNSNNNNNYKSLIRLFGYLLRTCIQILIDNKFIHSIKNEYNKYTNLVINLDSLNKNTTFSDWFDRLIQLIISNGIEENQLINDLNKITLKIFKNYIISNYKMDFWDKINLSEKNIKMNTIEFLKNDVIQENICWTYLNYDIMIFYKIIKLIYKSFGFNQFIKQIDKTNGYFEDECEYNINLLNLKSITDIINNNCNSQYSIEKYYGNIYDIIKNYIELDDVKLNN